jgi:hypothetical protein
MNKTAPLSEAQARFADANEATYSGPPSSTGCVFIYCEEPMSTRRWLVARDGTQLETERLSHA